jgi:hypothetical protein
MFCQYFVDCLQDPKNPTLTDRTFAAMHIVHPRVAPAKPAAAAARAADDAAANAVSPDRVQDGDGGGASAAAAPVKDKVLVDEIRQLQDYQYLTASEAISHLMGLEMHYFMHNVSVSVLALIISDPLVTFFAQTGGRAQRAHGKLAPSSFQKGRRIGCGQSSAKVDATARLL